MIDSIKKGIKDLKGTASELKDNRSYDKLVELVGEAGAQRAITHKLQEREITLEQWSTYRTVRTVIHKNPLNIAENVKEVDELTNGILDDNK
ncbi:hypothetical protein [Shewanella algae]|uniref:hypothetical protein n=1 Tax=Shewanella algae TaxID=38313 RepID=UPI003AADE878